MTGGRWRHRPDGLAIEPGRLRSPPGSGARRPVTATSVDVVVVAFGAPELLDALPRGPRRTTSRCVVVDNSSDADGAGRVASATAPLRRSRDATSGSPAGSTWAWPTGERPTDDVLLLNPDARSPPGAWPSCSVPAGHPGTGLRGPGPGRRTGGATARVGWPFPTPLGAWVEAVGLGRLRAGRPTS